MAKAALLTGSNMGERVKFLHFAEMKIGSLGQILNKSSIYESSAWGKTDQPAFLNQCIIIETSFAPLDLLHELKESEIQAGRIKTEKRGERTLDIDILFYENIVLNHPELVLPHPYLAARRFTLIPLAETEPDWIHPLLLKTANQLLIECEDKGDVRKFE
jgi:2-amino-4-hydroxy-6-hydroxymethyldihydropteridine diphosphokinase